MVFYVELAGQLIEIHSQYKLAQKKLFNYIVEPRDLSTVSFTISASRQDMLFEEAEMQEDIWRENNMYFSRDPQLLEYAAIHRKIAIALLEFNTLVVHGSVIDTDGVGIMLTGRSGIGKSERTRIWMEEFPESFVINGDKPFVRINNNQAFAYGNPWCGKEGWNTNTSVSLQSIFLLERVNEEMGEESSVSMLSFKDAFSVMLNQIFIPQDCRYMCKAISILMALQNKVRFYRFRSDLSYKAIHLAYDAAQFK